MRDIEDFITTSWKGARVLVLSPTPTHPQDYGNRKRIFQVCSRLKERGARIVFLHYPSEAEWRQQIPVRAEADMTKAWDRYYMIPPTRGVHADPKGDHHTIDEWWDDAIGGFLQWLFSVETFDAFIVNYTWLSKAFQYAPKSVAKILDTNDRFAGRKELLARNGVAPEFFYTTEKEERIALGRADIVWAIKDQERLEFAKLVDRPVLTLLHLDSGIEMAVPPPDPEGYLRVGIIGARNNVNLTNISKFLKEAIPVFDRYFAPIKLVLAGSVCEMFKQVDTRFVEVMGEVEDTADFYRTIDLAAIPMMFSTGLKIKAGEAISLRFPFVCLAHAFEGYPAKHPFHALGTFRELAEKLVEVSFNRSALQALRAASSICYDDVQASIDATLDATWNLVQSAKKTVLYCVDMHALLPAGVLNATSESAVRYLKIMSDVELAIVSADNFSDTARRLAVPGKCRAVVAEELLRERPVLQAAVAKHGLEVEAFSDIVARVRPDLIVADAVAPWMRDSPSANSTMVCRVECMGPDVAGSASDRLGWMAGRFRRTFVVGYRQSSALADLGHRLAAEVVTMPCMWRSDGLRQTFAADRRRSAVDVAVLGAEQMKGGDLVVDLLLAMDVRPVVVEAAVSGLAPTTGRTTRVSTNEFIESLFNVKLPLPRLAIDLSFGAPGLQLAREMLERARIPIISAQERVDSVGLTGIPGSLRAATSASLFGEITRALNGGDADAAAKAAAAELDRDGGWAWLWQYVSKLRSGLIEELI